MCIKELDVSFLAVCFPPVTQFKYRGFFHRLNIIAWHKNTQHSPSPGRLNLKSHLHFHKETFSYGNESRGRARGGDRRWLDLIFCVQNELCEYYWACSPMTSMGASICSREVKSMKQKLQGWTTGDCCAIFNISHCRIICHFEKNSTRCTEACKQNSVSCVTWWVCSIRRLQTFGRNQSPIWTSWGARSNPLSDLTIIFNLRLVKLVAVRKNTHPDCRIIVGDETNI